MSEDLRRIITLISKHRDVFIQPHDIPDPDAIASSFGLNKLLEALDISSKVIYAANIEKANSKKMIELFHVDMELMDRDYRIDEESLTIFVDTQMNHSNLTRINGSHFGAIDHHRFLGDENYIFMDIRPKVGACSTIVASYYKELNIIPTVHVATALLYGIMTDTDNLVRSNDMMDMEMFYWLYQKADLSLIKQLRMNEIGVKDLEAYTRALQNIEIYDRICFVDIGDCNDSLQGTISDMVFTIENVDVIVTYSKRLDGIKLSIRSGDPRVKANDLVSYIMSNSGAGGGHDEMAGGFMKKEGLKLMQSKNFDTYVRYRSIQYIERITEIK